MRNTLTKEQIGAVCNAYNNYVPIKEIAVEHNVSRSCIERNLKKAGITVRKGKLSAAQVSAICKAYTEGLSGDALAKKFKITKQSIFQRLHKNGIIVKNKNHLDASVVKQILTEYQETDQNMSDLSKKYGISISAIDYQLKKNNITQLTLSEARQQYTVDQSCLENIDTHYKAYFLGLFLADGCLASSNNTFGISLVEPDYNVLDNLRKIFNTNRPIATYPARYENDQNRCVFAITNKQLCNQMMKLGIGPQKSLTVQFPTCITDEFFYSFIAGVFDGDGCISHNTSQGRNRYSFEIAGSYAFITALHEKLRAITKFNPRIKPHGKIAVLRLGKEIEVYKFMKLLYANLDPKNCVQRKYNRFLELREKLVKNGRIASTD